MSDLVRYQIKGMSALCKVPHIKDMAALCDITKRVCLLYVKYHIKGMLFFVPYR